MEEFIAIYKGLRLPLLGLILIGIAIYLYRPKNKKKFEEIRYSMLEDEYTMEEKHEQ
jgi:cbb3-type cytochrome oxidase subunit 3